MEKQRVFSCTKKNMKTPTAKAIFHAFSNELQPDRLTEFLGMRPTTQWKKGDTAPVTGRVRTYGCWIVETAEIESFEATIQIAELVDLLSPKVQLLKDAQYKMDLEYKFEVVITICSDNSPSLALEPNVSRFLSALNAVIDFDIYVVL